MRMKRSLTLGPTLGGLAVAICLLLWKEFKLITFDVDFAASLGYAVQEGRSLKSELGGHCQVASEPLEGKFDDGVRIRPI